MSEPTPSAVPAVGVAAPPFSLPASNGQTVSLADYTGKRAVVLYFYPRADTPGCTTEACGFQDGLADYEAAGLAVVGVSPDPLEDVTNFAGKFHLTFPLLADEGHAVCAAYGQWVEKTMYGKKYMGAARSTFVIGVDGRVVHVFEKVKPDGHEREVLDWVKANLGR